jgi:hypothetical protein
MTSVMFMALVSTGIFLIMQGRTFPGESSSGYEQDAKQSNETNFLKVVFVHVLLLG